MGMDNTANNVVCSNHSGAVFRGDGQLVWQDRQTRAETKGILQARFWRIEAYRRTVWRSLGVNSFWVQQRSVCAWI